MGGSTPPTLQIQGGPFLAIEEVRINDLPSPSFIVQNDRSILAQVPSGVSPGTVSVVVLSSELLGAERVLLRHRLGIQTRRVDGLARLIQMFVRVLLMSPGTSLVNPALGGGLLQTLRPTYDARQLQGLQAEVYQAVQRAQEQLIALQASDPRTPREERLLSCKVERCAAHPSLGLLLDLALLSQTGKSYLVSAQL